MSDDQRPSRLPYRAWSGIYETLVGGKSGAEALAELIKKAVRWSSQSGEEAPADYLILDTFFSDSVEPNLVAQLFRENAGKFPMRFLLADPYATFGQTRGDSIQQDSQTESRRGLLLIFEALLAGTSAEEHTPHTRGSVVKLEYHDLAEHVCDVAKKCDVSIRFYDTAPSGPLFFLRDLLLAGRFAAGLSAVELPWNMIVSDPHTEDDLFDMMRKEFEYVWVRGYTRPGSSEEGGADGRREGYKVFLACAADGQGIARELGAQLEEAEIKCYLGTHHNDPGVQWTSEIRDQLASSNELVLILTPQALKSDWVRIELGAAWIMGKTILPAGVSAPLSYYPPLLAEHQALDVSTTEGKNELVRVIVERARKDG